MAEHAQAVHSGKHSETAEQSQGFVRPLSSRLLQPVTALLRLQRPRLTAVTTERQLRLEVSGTRGLAQQLEAETTIARGMAVAAEQLAKTTLRRHHALARRLLEQMSGETLGTVGFADTRTVQQPGCHPYRQTHLDNGRRRRLGTNSHGKQRAHFEKARTVLLFPVE